MNNSTRRTIPCQQWIKKDPIPTQEIQKNPILFFRNKSRGMRKLLNIIDLLSRYYKYVRPSQDKLATLCGLSRGHVSRLLKELEKAGVIARNYFHMQTCYYKLSSFFKDIRVRAMLGSLLVSFQSLSLLSSTAIQSAPQENVTQSINDLFIKRKSVAYYTNTSNRYVESDSVTRAREEKTVPLLKKERNYPMTAPLIQEITRTLKMDATKAQELYAYPEAALAAAFKRLKANKGKMLEPRGYFFAAANGYCRDHGLTIDRSNTRQARFDVEVEQASYPQVEQQRPSIKQELETRSHFSRTRYVDWDDAHLERQIRMKLQSLKASKESLQRYPNEENRKVVAATQKALDSFLQEHEYRVSEGKMEQIMVKAPEKPRDQYETAQDLAASLNTPGGEMSFRLLGEDVIHKIFAKIIANAPEQVENHDQDFY